MMRVTYMRAANSRNSVAYKKHRSKIQAYNKTLYTYITKHLFFKRVVYTWNGLPENIISTLF